MVSCRGPKAKGKREVGLVVPDVESNEFKVKKIVSGEKRKNEKKSKIKTQSCFRVTLEWF